MAQTKFIKRMTNYRPEVDDLIKAECEIRRNGGKGLSLTVNQIILEYFAARTPEIDPDEVVARPVSVEQPA